MTLRSKPMSSKKNKFTQFHWIYSDINRSAINRWKDNVKQCHGPHSKLSNMEPENTFGRWPIMHTTLPVGLNPYAYMWKTLQGRVYMNNVRYKLCHKFWNTCKKYKGLLRGMSLALHKFVWNKAISTAGEKLDQNSWQMRASKAMIQTVILLLHLE